MIMILSSAFDILLSFLILGLCWNQINASRQVTLTCGSDEATQKGSLGSPGKRGPKGSVGAPGRKGIFMYTITYSDLSKPKKKNQTYKFENFTVNKIIIT